MGGRSGGGDRQRTTAALAGGLGQGREEVGPSACLQVMRHDKVIQHITKSGGKSERRDADERVVSRQNRCK